MEFKKPNRYSDGRPRLNVPERSTTTFVDHPPIQPSPSTVTTTDRERVRQLLVTKRALILVSAVVVLVGCLVISSVIRDHEAAKKDTSKQSQAIVSPTYTTILPKGKSIAELGGWELVSPPKTSPVFAYVDKISGVPVSVSEQPLPASFKADPSDAIAELAKGYNATDKVNAGSTQVYIGTSAKGPQSVIFTKKNLLVLIKSETEISDTAWNTYVSALN